MMIINTENDDASKKMEENVRIWTMQRLNQSVWFQFLVSRKLFKPVR